MATKRLCEHIAAFLQLFMYLLNNNCQWREATKGELNICSNAEYPVTSAISNIIPYMISDFVVLLCNTTDPEIIDKRLESSH